MLRKLCSVRVWSSCQMAAAKEWYWKFDSAPGSAILFCSTHLSRTPIFPIYGSWAATLCDTSPGTRFLPITANLSNPGSSTACVFTVSPQEFSLHCTSTGITANLFYADFLPSPTHGAALLFDPSPWAACLPSATSHSHLFQTSHLMWSKQLIPWYPWNSLLNQALPLEHAPYSSKLFIPSRQLNMQPS